VSGQAVALNGVGEALPTAGQPFDACARHADAPAVAGQICNRYEQARAHDGLGRAWQALGQPDRARAHWQQALDLYSWLGVPEADQVRILLREGA
jgi:tetratricopeptide (TPR) repeat protein